MPSHFRTEQLTYIGKGRPRETALSKGVFSMQLISVNSFAV